ncbi:hypothetical protein ACJX0J_015455, partial [Zea mays]
VIFTNESNIVRWKNKRQQAVDSKVGRLDNFIECVKAPIQEVGVPKIPMIYGRVGVIALDNARQRCTVFLEGELFLSLCIDEGKIYDGDGFNYIKESFENGTLHLIGLLSDGGVQLSYKRTTRFTFICSIQLLLKGVSERGAKKIRVHNLTDGRDVLDGSRVGFVETLENDLLELRGKGIDAQIASGGGRMYVTMDRYENDWDVVKRDWDAQSMQILTTLTVPSLDTFFCSLQYRKSLENFWFLINCDCSCLIHCPEQYGLFLHLPTGQSLA